MLLTGGKALLSYGYMSTKLSALCVCLLGAAAAGANDLQQIADSLQVNPLTNETRRLEIPQANGVKVSLFATDYNDIISPDKGIIRKNLPQAVPVHVSFKVERGNQSAISKDYVVTVPGKEAGANPKPGIIPELLCWQGGQGNITLPEEILLYVDTKDNAVANMLARDIRDVAGCKVKLTKTAKEAHIIFEIAKSKRKVNEESYFMDIDDGKVELKSFSPRGLIMSSRTLLQMMRQYGRELPRGRAWDTPRYELRGFMLDVARLPFTLDYLYDVIRTMSWYKMNDLQLHLNDNYIFHEHYVDAGEDPFKRSYAAFRLQSNMKGLTAKDMFYTKDEFRKLVKFANRMGVNIVPEFDTPGHALSFTRIRPDLIYQGPMGNKVKRRCEMLDAANPETLRFVEKVFDEFLQPDGKKNAVFADCSAVHVGSDEFFGDKEDYRRFTDGILRHVLKRGYTPRVWGSLHAKPGKTPVVSKGVQMNLWSRDWGLAWESIAQGYDIINTHDRDLYIVPEAGYYRMDKNQGKVYNNWLPNRIGAETVPAGHPQLLGACYAIWNDEIDKLHNGYSGYNIRHTITSTLQTLSQKMWGKHTTPCSFDEFRALAGKIGAAPGSDFDLRANADKQAFELNAPTLPHKLGKGSLGPSYHMTMELELTEAPKEGEEQILLSSREGGELLAAMKDGNLGFRRADSIEFSFNYKLPVGKRVKLELIGHERETQLLIDGQPAGQVMLNNGHGRKNNVTSTFILPLENLGSTFKGKVYSMSVKP